tara:strand:+ start:693 stop:821 length:129 start_codon:yes stop_codon:yes gene_type:complete
MGGLSLALNEIKDVAPSVKLYSSSAVGACNARVFLRATPYGI